MLEDPFRKCYRRLLMETIDQVNSEKRKNKIVADFIFILQGSSD